MAANRFYSNTAVETTLTADINSGAVSINVASASGFPSSFPYTLVLDADTASREIVNVTARAGLLCTVTRGQDGTSAVSHSTGAVVTHDHTARDFREPQEHVGATTDVHGIGASSSVVGTTATQILSNKDLTAGTNIFPASLATLTGSQTLSNKTLASSTVFPATVINTTSAQSMTNKNLSDPTNTFPTSLGVRPGQCLMTFEAITGGGALIDGAWIKCDGTAVSRTTYPALNAVAAAVGYAAPWGPGNGSTTFNVPDMRSRFPVGAGSYHALGENEGMIEANRDTVHTHPINSTSHNGVSTTTGGGSLDRVISISGQLSGSHNHGGDTTGGSGKSSFPHMALHFLVHI